MNTAAAEHRNTAPAPAPAPEKPSPPPVLPLPDGELWVFGYGSLMWRPGFAYAEARKARIYGYHRNLCIWSWHYRGTPAKPGLVFGLQQGGSCVGRAFRVKPAQVRSTIEYLHQREMITDVYQPGLRTVYLNDEDPVQSLVFIADSKHRQYAGTQPLRDVIGIVADAHGRQGSNYEYVMQTAGQLVNMGIFDKSLHTLYSAMHNPPNNQNQP